MNDLIQLETDGLSINPDTSVEVIADVLNRLQVIKERTREAEALIEQRLVERIREAGPFVVGTIRYYVGVKRTTKCIDVPATLDALLTVTGGDWGAMAQLLAAQPVKHGAAKGVLDEATYDRLFKVDEADELREGKLQKADTRFLNR